MKFLNKILVVFLVVSITLFSFTGCKSASIKSSTSSQSTAGLTVHYLDVGQADSILVQVNGKNLLIDAGNREDDTTILGYLEKQGVKKLDYIIATHPHEDHIGGMASVIRKMEVGSFYAPKVTATTKTFEGMLAALNAKKLKINVAKAKEVLDLGKDVTAEFLAPNGKEYEDQNNYSAVLKLTYHDSKFLFMGDAQNLSEAEILKSGADVSCDVLKAGHHGSHTSSSKEFLDKAKPKIAIISCGKGNTYGHPHKEILETFKKRSLQILRTDETGTVVLFSDGKKIIRK